MRHYEYKEIESQLDKEIQLCGSILSGDDYLTIQELAASKTLKENNAKLRKKLRDAMTLLYKSKTITGRRQSTITKKNTEIRSLNLEIKSLNLKLEQEREHQKILIAKHREMKNMLLAERSKKIE